MAQLLKTFRRRFGIAARQVSVRTHIPWYWRWCGIAVALTVIAGVGWITYEYGMAFAGFHHREAKREIARLAEAIRTRDAEISELRFRVAEAERQREIERATYGHLAGQVKVLSTENASLKEDLAFFQSLMAAGGSKQPTLSVNRFEVHTEALPGEYRYRLLLVQTGQRVKEFRGKLQFVLNVEQNGREFVLTLPPDSQQDAKDFRVNFRFFQRIEGTFTIAPDAVVKSMQVRVFENGANTPKLTQTVSVS
jgi:hypothetical protein